MQPVAYTRTKNFTDDSGSNTDHPAINSELDNAALSINQLRANLALIQADDGSLSSAMAPAGAVSPYLPGTLVGNALKMLRVNAAETAYEHRTPAQILSDLGATTVGEAVFKAATEAAVRAILSAAKLGANDDINSFSALASINGGQIAGQRNKLINPFTENQRALTSVADDTYCLDRWYVLTESGNVTIAQIDGPESGAPKAIRLTQPDAVAKRMGLAQIIEAKDIKQYRSAAMNLYMRIKPSFAGNVRYAIIEHTGAADVVTSDVVNNWASAVFTAGNFFIAGLNIIKTGTVAPGAATYGDLNDFGTFGAALNNAILFVWTESAQAQNATLELNRPQFEPGVVHTLHEWRLNELTLCQRYYYEDAPLVGFSLNALTAARASSLHPVEMFAAPTVTVSNAVQFFDGAIATATGAIVSYSTTRYVQLDITTNAVLTAGHCAARIAGTGKITVSAPL